MTDMQTETQSGAMATHSIKAQVNRVVACRAALDKNKAVLKPLVDAFERQHQALYEARRSAVEALLIAEDGLRDLTVSYYTTTKEKPPVPGVGIREKTSIEYNDAEALQWCLEHNMAVTFDRAKFETLVLAQAVPETLATVKKTPTATIATRLEALPDVA